MREKIAILLVVFVFLITGCSSETNDISTENTTREAADTQAEQQESIDNATESSLAESSTTENNTTENNTTAEHNNVADREADGVYAKYYQLIDKITNGIENGFSVDEIDELGISPLFGLNIDFLNFGYKIMDIDGNGVDELLIGENGTEAWNGVIYNMYTLEAGEMVNVICGWDRNRYYLCENGLFANEGSSGADSSMYGYYSYSGGKLEMKEAVIYDGNKNAENPLFYSTKSYDVDQAINITSDEASEIINSYKHRAIEFIPFQ